MQAHTLFLTNKSFRSFFSSSSFSPSSPLIFSRKFRIWFLEKIPHNNINNHNYSISALQLSDSVSSAAVFIAVAWTRFLLSPSMFRARPLLRLLSAPVFRVLSRGLFSYCFLALFFSNSAAYFLFFFCSPLCCICFYWLLWI